MANLVELSNQLEDFPEQQLVQMSQDPNSMYPSYLVLSEIQRRNQMRKMYEAQQPKPQTTVAEEVIGEFAGQQGLQGAMAQSPGPQDAFPPSDMGNMAPPSPMQAMASGGIVGYKNKGKTEYKEAADDYGKQLQEIFEKEGRYKKRYSDYEKGERFTYPLTPRDYVVSDEEYSRLKEGDYVMGEGALQEYRPFLMLLNALDGESGARYMPESEVKGLKAKLKASIMEDKLSQMGMASGGRTGFQAGGFFVPQNPGTFEEFKEKMIGEYIAATGKSRKEAEIFANENAKQRYSETVGNSQAQQNNTRRDSLLFSPNMQDALLNNTPLPESIQSLVDKAQEPSGFNKFAEAGTEFFFGPERPDAERPNLARMTDQPSDYLNYILPAKGLQLGLGGLKSLIQGGKALKQSDNVIDLTKVNPSKVDNILPNTVPKTGGTPPVVVPRTGGTPPTSGLPVGPPRPPGTNLVPSGGPLVPSGGPLAVVPKVADDVAVKSKGLISKGIDWIKNNKKAAFGYGLLGGLGGATAYYSGEPKKDNGAGGAGSTAPTTKEIKRSIDPLDLAKLGGIIMGAKNTSELGQGITALAGDIQERRYKEGVLKSKEEAMIIDRVNSLTKMLDDMNEGTPEYIRTFNARQSLIDSYYGPMAQGTDPMSILNANTASGTNNSNVSNINSLPNTNLGGSLGLSGSSLTDTFINAANQKKKLDINIIPQQDLYNAFIKDAPNPEYLTGDPYIDNIMRIESGGMDRTNSITGASGPMQVKPATLADPGYGVEPAKDDSVEERIRVGADYFNAMKEVFDGDILNATIAFNLGPGATKKWLQAGGTAEELVKIQSSDGRPVGQTALEYIQKAYGPDIINRLS